MVSFLPELSATLGDISPPQPQSVQDAMDIINAHGQGTTQIDWNDPEQAAAAARRAAIRNGVDPDTFDAQIKQESGYNPDVIFGRTSSPAGAQGIAQFMPATAASLGINPLNPEQALDAGAKYLKQQIDYFGGDVRKGLAAYNAGAGNVQQAIAKGGNWEDNLPGETQRYLSVITGKGDYQASIGNALGSAVGQIANPTPATGTDLGGIIGSSIAKLPARQDISNPDQAPIGSPVEGNDFSAAPQGSLRYQLEQERQGQAQGPRSGAILPAASLLAGGVVAPVPTLLGAAAESVPGYQNLPGPVKTAAQIAPFVAGGPGGLVQKAAEIGGATAGSELGGAGAKAVGLPEWAGQLPGMAIGGGLGGLASRPGALDAAIPRTAVGEAAYGAGGGLSGGNDLERQVAEQAARDAALPKPKPGTQEAAGQDARDAAAAKLPPIEARPPEHLKTAPPVVDAPTAAYHGTGTDFKSFEEGALSQTSLYGPGVYLTDNRPVAEGYANAGERKVTRSLANEPAGMRQRLGLPDITPGAQLQRVEIPAGTKLVNLEQPLPKDVVSMLARNASDAEQSGIAPHDIDAWIDAAKAALDGKKGTEVYRAFRQGLGDSYVGDAGESLDVLNQEIKALGYDGLAHTGGAVRGGEPHNVSILFDAEKAQITGAERLQAPTIDAGSAPPAAPPGSPPAGGPPAPPTPPSGGPPTIPPTPPTGANLPQGGGGRPPSEVAAQKLVTQVQMSEQLPADTETARRAVRSQRAAQSYSVMQGEGDPEALARRSRGSVFQTGEMPVAQWAPPQGNFTPEDRQALFQTLNDQHGALGPYRHAQAVDAVDKVLGGDYSHLTAGDMKLLSDIYGPELEQAIKDKVSAIVTPQRLSDKIYNAASRGLANLGDLISAPITTATFGHAPVFRQGLGTAVSHPLSAGLPALKDFWSVIANPENRAAIQAGLKANPWVEGESQLATGLVHSDQAVMQIRARDFTDYNARPQQTAVRNVMEKLGLSGNRFQEAAAQYLDSLRKLAYSTEAQRLFESNMQGAADPREYKALWDTISNATGFSARENPTVLGVNPAFSWKAMAGRFKSLADPIVQPGSINPLDPGARSTAIRNLLGIAAFGTTIMGLDQLAGGKANLDIGKGGIKTKVGLTTLDPYAGMGSIVRLMASSEQAVQNAKNPEDAIGKLVPVIQQFANGQISPGYQYIASILTGKDWRQQPVDVAQATRNLFKGALPIAAKSIYDAITENQAQNGNGLEAGIRALPSLGALGTETRLGVNDVRDQAAQKLGAKDYASAGPIIQKQVDTQNKAELDKVRGGPTPYSVASEAAHAPILAETARQEALFNQGQNDKALRDVYHDEGIANRQAAHDLEDQFAKQFAGFNKTKYDAAIESYYGQPKTDAKGNIDFDATAADRADKLAKMPPDVQEWVKQSLQVTEGNKTPLHQQYDKYINDKKAAGYFAIDPNDPKANEKRTALDIAHPELDEASWKYGATTGKEGSALNSPKAVDLALADPFSQHTPVKLSGIDRPINESPKSIEAWGQSKVLVNSYASGDLLKFNWQGEAQRLFQETHDKAYDVKSLDELDSQHRATVHAAVNRAVLKSAPQIDAWLVWWGAKEKPDDNAAAALIAPLVQRYGPIKLKKP